MGFPLRGLIAAAYTPLDEQGRLRRDAIEELADLYAEAGVSGVFICGTTGECHSLSVDERRRTTEAWCSAASDRLTLIAHVGSNCLPDAQALAAHAKQAGVHGVAAMAPSFFKPQTVDQLVDFCEPIASAAEDLPFYYYHIPSMTGVEVPMGEFLQRGAQRIGNLAGLKFTSNDLMALQECLALDEGEFDILFGHDENLLAGWSLGVRGVIGSTYNYAATLYHRIIEAYETGDMPAAQREQAKSVMLVRTLHRFGLLAAGKAIMRMMGVDCGPVRLPLKSLTEQQVTQLFDSVKHLDVFCRPLNAASVPVT